MVRLWLALALILVLAFPAQADGPGPHKVHLPIIGAECDMTTLATLEISDGEVTADLLRGRIHLSDWKPTIPQLKAGGIWQDSALATGRRMVDRRFGNVSDSLSLIVSSPNQDDTIREAADLMHLLEKARDYTASGWQTDPVWIKRQAGCETNPTYALIFDYKIPNLSNPYAAPFAAATNLATLDNFSLSLEHSIWLGNQPGTGTCVQASGVQVGWNAQGSAWEDISNPAIAPVFGGQGFVQRSTTGAVYLVDWVAGGNVKSSADNGVTWNNRLSVATYKPASVAQAANGDIYAGLAGPTSPAAAQSRVYQSTDGINFNLVDAVIPGSVNPMRLGIVGLANGYVLAAHDSDAGVIIRRSIDDGATWNTVYTTPRAYAVYDAIQLANGWIVMVAQGGIVLRSKDSGDTWEEILLPALMTSPSFVYQLTSGLVIVGGISDGVAVGYTGISTDNGTTWGTVTTPTVSNPCAVDMDVDARGVLRMGNGVGNSLISADGYSWQAGGGLTDLYGVITLQNGDTLAANAATGHIYRLRYSSSPAANMGMSDTCSDAVFLANKQNVSNIANIYINDGGAWSANLFPFTFPGHTHLLPAAPVVGDAVYFGIDSSLSDSGPFESLVFDLGTILTYTVSYTIVWEYYTGAAWATLTVQDGTNPGTGVFRVPGVSSVHWTPPTNWATRALNLDGGPAVTGYWVRARVSASGGAMTAPSQQNRNIYTVVLPYADVAAAQVPGDIPALAQVKLHNRSDADGRAGNAPNLWDNRVIVGLRSYDRGPTFTAYLNASDEQNPVGVTVTLGANTTVPAGISGITGKLCTWAAILGDTTFTDRVTFTLGPTIARDFYGTFHAFLRGNVTAGALGDIHARLQVRTGSGGVTLTSAEDHLKGTTDYEVLDFGRVSIPASGLLSFDDLGDSTQLAVQFRNDSGAARTVYVHDLILIPVDEWATDATDYANIAASVVGRQSSTPHLLDFDSLTYQKVDVRTLVRTADGNGFVTSIYVPGGGPVVLQANARQRLWVFAMQTDDVGADPIWLASPFIAHSVQVWASSRWLGFRGDR